MNETNKLETEAYGFTKNYSVTMYFDKQVELDRGALQKSLEKSLGKVSLNQETDSLLQLNATVEGMNDDNQTSSIEYSLLKEPIGPRTELLNAYISQTWDWKEANTLVGKVQSQVTLTDNVGVEVLYQRRIVLFQLILFNLVETLQPIGLQWHASGQLIDPKVYLSNVPGTEAYDFLYGPLNVRMFSIEGEEGATIMDTLGLAALGLVDIQSYFSGFNIEDVANLLYEYGTYIFINGDVIKDGETIESYEQYKKWGCRHEISQLEPRRAVLNIGPDVKV